MYSIETMLVLLVCAFVYSVSANVAPFLTPCKNGDTACLMASAKKAVPYVSAGTPDLGLPSLDPMFIEHAASREAGLELDMTNTTVKGLKNCEILTIKRNGKKIYLEVKCSITLSGDYRLGGKLLILPIEGQGKYKIKIRDIVVKIQLETADLQREGETYWKIASWKHTTDVLTNVHFNFQNLFNGNQQASDTIHQFANSNWKEIYHELGPPVTTAVVTKIVNTIEKMFAVVPVKEITLD